MVIGILRVKNEARWIVRCVSAILPLCDRVLVMDDHSDDGTPFLCASLPGVDVFDSPFAGLDETRDKNYLLDRARAADWVICVDGDEMLKASGVPYVAAAMKNPAAQAISMRIPYLWDSEEQIRVDGVYGAFRRHSAFRPRDLRFRSSTAGGFHCGNVPYAARLHTVTLDEAPLLHFGYMHAEDRARKYAWYNAQDPNNQVEDCYRHVAAGLPTPHADLVAMQKRMRSAARLPELTPHEILPAPPAAVDRTMHAGPLRLETL